RIAAARLAWPEHREGNLRLGEELRHRAHDLAVALVEGARAANPVEHTSVHAGGRVAIGPAHRAVTIEDRHLQPLRPVEAGAARLTPRIAGGLHVAEGGVQLLGEAALFEHQVAAYLHDRVDMLDEHRAAFHA